MSQNTDSATACVLIIGDEILSGRTQDLNLQYIAKTLRRQGVLISVAHVIPDVEETIIEYVNVTRNQHDYVLTTGGIGPTHDDITAKSIAAAFKVPLIMNEVIAQRIRSYSTSTETLNNRLRMAYVPQGAGLIENLTGGPHGFYINNVYAMAGIPRVLQSMLPTIQFRGGVVMHSGALEVFVGESWIAADLKRIQEENQVKVGSYPFRRKGKYCTTVVVRSHDKERILKALDRVKHAVQSRGETNGNVECDWLQE